MKASTLGLHGEFSENQKAALLKLLTDEDPEVFAQIRDLIVANGPQAARWLRQYALNPDPVLRRRTTAIVRQFEQHAADNEFVVFCLKTGQNLDLEKGMLLLGRTVYPDINMEGYSAMLDTYASELRDRLQPSADAEEKLTVMSSYLFEELGFSGNAENYYDPQNSYFNRVLDRRTGIPITLCALYILLAKRLRLPITGIGFPGHFLCRYQSSQVEIYIDAFDSGRLMTKVECIRYLLHGKSGAAEAHLTPVSPRQILMRMCANLQQIYQESQNSNDATRLRRYIVALSG